MRLCKADICRNSLRVLNSRVNAKCTVELLDFDGIPKVNAAILFSEMKMNGMHGISNVIKFVS